MTWWLPIAAGAPLLLLLFVAGLPAFVCFLILNLIGLLALTGPAGFGLFAASIFTTANINALAGSAALHIDGRHFVPVRGHGGSVELARSPDRTDSRAAVCALHCSIRHSWRACPAPRWRWPACLDVRCFPRWFRRGYDVRLSVGTILGGASWIRSFHRAFWPSSSRHWLRSRPALLVAGILPGFLLWGCFCLCSGSCLLEPGLAPDSAADVADRRT